MGFFDKLTESAFKELENGEAVYYPNGVMGKGRIVKDPVQKVQLFKYHKRLIKYLLPFAVLYGIIIGLGDGNTLVGFIPLMIVLTILFVRQRFLIKGLPVSGEKLTVKDAMTSASKAYHPAFVIFMVLNSVALIILSLLLPFVLGKSVNELLSLIIMTFVTGIVSLGVSLYLYKARRIAAGSE